MFRWTCEDDERSLRSNIKEGSGHGQSSRGSTFYNIKIFNKGGSSLDDMQARVSPSQSDDSTDGIKTAQGAVSPDLFGAKVIVQGWVLSGAPAVGVCYYVLQRNSRFGGKCGYVCRILINTRRCKLGLSCLYPRSVLYISYLRLHLPREHLSINARQPTQPKKRSQP